MAREDAATKGRRYLTEGRLIIRLVDTEEIRATARGDGDLYELGFMAGRGWWCECPAVTDQCSHLRALRLVTVRITAGQRPDFFPHASHDPPVNTLREPLCGMAPRDLISDA